MNKSRIVVALAILFPLQVFAAQQPLQTRANTTSPSVDTNFTRQQLNNTELYTTKADKDKVVRVWADHPDGTQIAAKTLVAYDGKLYTTLQAFDKVSSSATPDVLTAYFKVAGVTNYSELDGKPTLGTAAALNVGSTPGSVVQLDNEGKFPAGDGSRITGISGTIPSGSTTGQTVEWDATNSIWTPVDWNTLSADGNSLTISSGVLSVAGAASSANSSVLGRNSLGVFGFNPISDYVSTSGLLPVTQEADPTASDADGIYVATVSGKVFIKSSMGLVSWAATITPWDTTPDQWIFTAQTGLAVSTEVLSNTVTVAGTNSTAPISASGSPGCGYKKNTASCTNVAGNIVNGDTIQACVTTSPAASTETTCTLTSAGMTAVFSATTGEVASEWAIEDNFTIDTIADYTKISGSGAAVVLDGALYNSIGGGTSWWGFHETDLGSSNQTVQAVIQDRVGSTTGASTGLLLRSNGVSGYSVWVDVGSSRFQVEPVGAAGTSSFKDFTSGAWLSDAKHLVQVSVGAANTFKIEVDFNDDGDFSDTNEQVGVTSVNTSIGTAGTKVGVGHRYTGTSESVDSFKAKVYVP